MIRVLDYPTVQGAVIGGLACLAIVFRHGGSTIVNKYGILDFVALWEFTDCVIILMAIVFIILIRVYGYWFGVYSTRQLDMEK